MLAALWGGSFLFMRIAAPVLGPTLLIAYRVALAAVFLLGCCAGAARARPRMRNARRSRATCASIGATT